MTDGSTFGDWRLPNVRELESINHYGRPDPAIYPAFSGRKSSTWSSTSAARSPEHQSFAWVSSREGSLHFRTYGYKGNSESFVRAVRNAR